MKFQKLAPFEAHFKSSFPDHLSPIYVIVCPKEGERKKVLASLIQRVKPDADLKTGSTIKEALDHVNTASLLATRVVALFDGLELLIKSEVELVSQYVSNPNPQNVLILGAASIKYIAELYKKGKKEMVIVDLSGEKPWEEKERLQKWVVQLLHVEKKEIAPDALQALFSQLPLDRLLLQQELEKLICYVGENPRIEKKDVETICSTSLEEKPFQLAQAIVWGNASDIPLQKDVSSLLSLVGILRSQFEIGLKMGAMLNKHLSHDEIAPAFPKMWPKALKQCLNRVQKKGLNYFKSGLMGLFELELSLKSSRTRPEVLFELFFQHSSHTLASSSGSGPK